MRRCGARPPAGNPEGRAVRGLTEDPCGNDRAGWRARRPGRSGCPPNGRENPDKTDHLGTFFHLHRRLSRTTRKICPERNAGFLLGGDPGFAYAGATVPPVWLRANTPLNPVRVART